MAEKVIPLGEAGVEKPKPLASGTTEFPTAGKFNWEIVPSRKKAVTNGQHLILSVTPVDESSRLGPEEQTAFVATAMHFADEHLGGNYRLTINMGTVRTRSRFHVHLMAPEEGDLLPRETTNVQQVLDNLAQEFENIPPEIVGYLRSSLLQNR